MPENIPEPNVFETETGDITAHPDAGVYRTFSTSANKADLQQMHPLIDTNEPSAPDPIPESAQDDYAARLQPNSRPTVSMQTRVIGLGGVAQARAALKNALDTDSAA